MPDISGPKNIIRIFRFGKKYHCKETAVYKISTEHVDHLFAFINRLNETKKGCGKLFKYLIIPFVILIIAAIILFVASTSKLVPAVLLACSFVFLIINTVIIIKLEQKYQTRINQVIMEFRNIFKKTYVVTDDNGYRLRKEFEMQEQKSNRYKIRIIPREMTYEDEYSDYSDSSMSDIGTALINKKLKDIKQDTKQNDIHDIETGISVDKFKKDLHERNKKKEEEEE